MHGMYNLKYDRQPYNAKSQRCARNYAREADTWTSSTEISLSKGAKGDESLVLQAAGNRNIHTEIIHGYVTAFSQQHLGEFL
jgi:hypothetical protein